MAAIAVEQELAVLVATSFWLAYFDFFSIRGERILSAIWRARIA